MNKKMLFLQAQGYISAQLFFRWFEEINAQIENRWIVRASVPLSFLKEAREISHPHLDAYGTFNFPIKPDDKFLGPILPLIWKSYKPSHLIINLEDSFVNLLSFLEGLKEDLLQIPIYIRTSLDELETLTKTLTKIPPELLSNIHLILNQVSDDLEIDIIKNHILKQHLIEKNFKPFFFKEIDCGSSQIPLNTPYNSWDGFYILRSYLYPQTLHHALKCHLSFLLPALQEHLKQDNPEVFLNKKSPLKSEENLFYQQGLIKERSSIK